MAKEKEEGIVKVTIQGADGNIQSLILPTQDVDDTADRATEILSAYGYGDFKILNTNILRGKILK